MRHLEANDYVLCSFPLFLLSFEGFPKKRFFFSELLLLRFDEVVDLASPKDLLGCGPLPRRSRLRI